MRFDREAVETLLDEVATTCLLPHFENLSPEDIETKLGDDPVTVADKASEKALTKALKKILPGSQVLGEEGYFADPTLGRLFDDEAPLWILDPLDGTRQFVAGEPSFGIIVALAWKKETVAGWLYMPMSGELVTAEKGAGAYAQGKRLKVLEGGALSDLRGRLGKKILDVYLLERMQNNNQRSPSVRKLGGACENYCRLACGPAQEHFRANYIMDTPWDDAAGVLIHAEAGGYAAPWTGKAYQPSAYHQGLLAAPDPETWEALRSWIEGFCPLPR